MNDSPITRRRPYRDEVPRQVAAFWLFIGWCLLWTWVGLSLSACTVIKHPTAGTYASLGGDTRGFVADSTGMRFDSNENSVAFNEALKAVRKMWQAYVMYRGFEYVAGKYYDNAATEVNAATSVKLEELRSAESVKLAEIKLEELKAMEALPEG